MSEPRYFYEPDHIAEPALIYDEDGGHTGQDGEMLKEGFLVFDATIGRGGESSGKDGYVAFCLQRTDAERIVAALNAAEAARAATPR